jgi:hypothetical protein
MLYFFRSLHVDIKMNATIFASVLAIYVGASIFGASACMRIPRLPLQESSPASVGLEFQNVSFTSRTDGVELKGWFLPASSDSVILIVNGGFQNRVDPIVGTLNLSRDLVNRGYNILLFDLRGRGESLGEATISRVEVIRLRK